MHGANAKRVATALPGQGAERIVPRASADAQIVVGRRAVRSVTSGRVTTVGS